MDEMRKVWSFARSSRFLEWIFRIASSTQKELTSLSSPAEHINSKRTKNEISSITLPSHSYTLGGEPQSFMAHPHENERIPYPLDGG